MEEKLSRVPRRVPRRPKFLLEAIGYAAPPLSGHVAQDASPTASLNSEGGSTQDQFNKACGHTSGAHRHAVSLVWSRACCISPVVFNSAGLMRDIHELGPISLPSRGSHVRLAGLLVMPSFYRKIR